MYKRRNRKIGPMILGSQKNWSDWRGKDTSLLNEITKKKSKEDVKEEKRHDANLKDDAQKKVKNKKNVTFDDEVRDRKILC